MAQEIADSTLLDTWGSSGAKIEPDITKIIEGWQLGEQPPHEYMNWLQNTFGSKLNHILKNGIASWNNTTQYLAGSSVQHTGNVWLCKATNTNSAPTDANANWKRIITVESLTTILGGYVATTGNQTIAGIKTFSSSPIVPTPTTGTQVANKDYVDANAGISLTTANSYDLGVEQTWQNVTASRSVGVTYTNTTGKPIQVIIVNKAGTANVDFNITIDGVIRGIFVNAGQPTSNQFGMLTAIIPNGSTYSTTSLNSSVLNMWQELR